MGKLYQRVWADVLHQPLDELSHADDTDARRRLKKLFLDGEWHEVYDVLEFVIREELIQSGGGAGFIAEVDRVLLEEIAGFRLLEREFVEVSDEAEMQAIEDALEAARDRFGPAREHLATALTHLSNRSAPDYRNSVKESISAVEAVTRILSGEPKAELGKALKIIEGDSPLHGGLRRALESGRCGPTATSSG